MPSGHLGNYTTLTDATAVFEDFQKVTALGSGQDGEAPIVDDQHLHARDGFEDTLVAAIAPSEGEGFEHTWGTLVEDGPPIPASLMSKRAGDPTFAQARGTCDQQVLVTGDPSAIRKMGHDTAVQATGCAQVEIFDAGSLAQSRELEPRG
jgi:hypothetical protein